jgi:hypothetical protein
VALFVMGRISGTYAGGELFARGCQGNFASAEMGDLFYCLMHFKWNRVKFTVKE